MLLVNDFFIYIFTARKKNIQKKKKKKWKKKELFLFLFLQLIFLLFLGVNTFLHKFISSLHTNIPLILGCILIWHFCIRLFSFHFRLLDGLDIYSLSFALFLFHHSVSSGFFFRFFFIFLVLSYNARSDFGEL